MNIAIIFAGGVGIRMHTKELPKQFLLIHGKPIIVHTIEAFQSHKEIDGIIVSCVEDWITYMEEMKYRYRLDKVGAIVPGGETGQLSIFKGLLAAKNIYGINKNIVLIHDGVRPIISEKEISDNINSVKENGSAITCANTKETFVLIDKNGEVVDILDRDYSCVAKAPQSFYLKDLIEAHEKAIAEGMTNIVDSCTLMRYYGHSLSVVNGSYKNIKITTPDDFYMFRALFDAKENKQLEE